MRSSRGSGDTRMAEDNKDNTGTTDVPLLSFSHAGRVRRTLHSVTYGAGPTRRVGGVVRTRRLLLMYSQGLFITS